MNIEERLEPYNGWEITMGRASGSKEWMLEASGAISHPLATVVISIRFGAAGKYDVARETLTKMIDAIDEL